MEKHDFQIYKSSPGSGATSTLLSVGWVLERSQEAMVFVVKASLTSDFWKRICSDLKQQSQSQSRSWVVLLVDEEIERFNDGISGYLDLQRSSPHSLHPQSSLPFKISILHITLRAHDKAHSQINLTPILSLTFLPSFCQQLHESLQTPEIAEALGNLVSYALAHPEDMETRHISFVMFTTVNGVFVSPQSFLRTQIEKMTSEFERKMISLLAFLSLYSDSFREIDGSALDFHLLSKDALELTSWRQRKKEKITFLPPCLAGLYLTLTPRDVYGSLQMALDNFDDMMARHLRLSQHQRNDLALSLFLIDPKEKPWTALPPQQQQDRVLVLRKKTKATSIASSNHR
jgi:hypothetical protein